MITKTLRLYEGRDDVTLTTYVIAEKGELNVLGKRPAVLICPGGAYLGCSDREAEPVALKFAAMGYHAFVLRYSTYSEGGGFIDFSKPLPEKKHCQHPNPMRDIGKAMLMLREHSEEWFLDMERVAVCGFSAGAHNAAMFGVYWNKPIMTDYLKTTKESIRPAALILGYGYSDYFHMIGGTQTENVNIRQEIRDLAMAANMAFFGDKIPDKDLLETVSLARLVTENMPPVFLWATSDDFIIPVNQSTTLANALAEKKIPFEMHIFEKGTHGLSIATQASSVDTSQVNADVAKWVDLAECWLKKRFALHLPESSF